MQFSRPEGSEDNGDTPMQVEGNDWEMVRPTLPYYIVDVIEECRARCNLD
jgi:delta-aminolevulinic acid dehydratase/porphobilinogen synthase